MARKSAATEDPAHAAVHCLKQYPYRLIVYSRSDGYGTPLFLVAGSPAREAGAEKALREAHRLHGGECFYCRQQIPGAELTIDHVEPEVLGGRGHLQNLVLAHKGCNAAKGHKIIEAFDPDAGREWLNALLLQVQDRLNRL
jgi:hypothetical protein